MSTSLRAIDVDSSPPDTPAIPVSVPNDEPSTTLSAASLVLPPSSLHVEVDPTTVQSTTIGALDISPDTLPDAPTVNEQPLCSSTAPNSSMDTHPSDSPVPADDGIPSMPSGEGSPACSDIAESEPAGHPASDAVSPLHLHSPTPGRVSDVRRLSSVGVQTHIMLTKRGEQALCMCDFVKFTRIVCSSLDG